MKASDTKFWGHIPTTFGIVPYDALGSLALLLENGMD